MLELMCKTIHFAVFKVSNVTKDRKLQKMIDICIILARCLTYLRNTLEGFVNFILKVSLITEVVTVIVSRTTNNKYNRFYRFILFIDFR